MVQLINARTSDGQVCASPPDIVPLIEALAAFAAVALDKQVLIEAQKRLFKSHVEMIANAIDAKSLHTGGHCRRVPELTAMLARAANEATEGPFTSFSHAAEERAA